MSDIVKNLAFLFRSYSKARPVLLLGAGASFRSGIPLADETVRRIAHSACAKERFGLSISGSHLMLSDWLPWLRSQPWFIQDPDRFAENFPLAVEHLLTPREFRRAFFQDLIHASQGASDGYKALARMMVRRLIGTVLTTNFDGLIAETLREQVPKPPTITEIKTPDDRIQFGISNEFQIVHLHGSVEHYKGDEIPRDQTKNKRPYLTPDQAAKLAGRVISEYRTRREGLSPSRLIFHKTSKYEPEEVEGFQNIISEIPSCELVSLAPTGFRLLKRGVEEPDRGTLCTVEDSKNYLFTTGYVKPWQEYPGPHIPSPLEIGSVTGTDVYERSREVLSLTKVNWNNAEGIGRYPITLTFARKVGVTMTEFGEDDKPNPLYRYYM